MKPILIDNKYENVEILRAVAILFVMFVHFHDRLIFPSSLYSLAVKYFDFSIGVDLFFVISGFVITRSFAASLDSGKAKKIYIVMAFWIKRTFRLLPLAFLGILIVIVHLSVMGELWDGQSLKLKCFIPIGASAASFLNLYNAYCVANPMQCPCGIYPIGHYWSLSLEEQFYLVFPLVFILLRKRQLIGLLIILIGLQIFWLRPMWTYAWFFRTDGFCWGILLALISFAKIKVITQINPNKIVLQIISCFLVFLLPFTASNVMVFGQTKAYGVSLIALISALLVFMAIRYPISFGTWQPYRQFMLYIGSRSYALYVFHFIVFSIIRDFWIANAIMLNVDRKLVNLAYVSVCLAVTVLLAEFSYRFIERGFRLKGRKLAEKFLSRQMSHANSSNAV